MADEIAQLTDGHRRDETRSQQAVLQQLCQPLCITDIGLSAGHILDMRGIDQQRLELGFEDVEDRTPILAGRFHRDVRHATLVQPIGECQQVDSHGLEGARLVVPPARRDRSEAAGDDRSFVNIQFVRVLTFANQITIVLFLGAPNVAQVDIGRRQRVPWFGVVSH